MINLQLIEHLVPPGDDAWITSADPTHCTAAALLVVVTRLDGGPVATAKHHVGEPDSLKRTT